MKDLDLLIIGAGPAGLSTALHLVQSDPSWRERLIVIDKESHPRPKLCAGGLTPMGIKTLLGLGLPNPLPLNQAPVKTAIFRYDSRTISVKGNPRFLVFDRPELDHFLAQKAMARGVELREDEAAREIEIGSSAVYVKTQRDTYLVKAVVGADGTLGLTQRVLRSLKPDSGHSHRMARAMETRIPVEEGKPHFTHQLANFDYNALKENLQGYLWAFPTYVNGVPHLNCGIYDARTSRSRPRAALPRLLNDFLVAHGGVPNSLDIRAYPLHWFSPHNTFSAPRLLLVGDAAGSDPLFGEGVGPALAYGKLAAGILQNSFEREEFSFSEYLPRLRSSYLGRYLMIRWIVARIVYNLGDRSAFAHIFWTIAQAVALGYRFL